MAALNIEMSLVNSNDELLPCNDVRDVSTMRRKRIVNGKSASLIGRTVKSG